MAITRPVALVSSREDLWANLHRGGAADHSDHRIVLVLDPFRQEVLFDTVEAGSAQITFDKVCVPVIIERSPDRDGFCPEAAVGEADDERRARPQHPPNLAK